MRREDRMSLYLCLLMTIMVVAVSTGHVELGVGVNVLSILEYESPLIRTGLGTDADSWLLRQKTPPVFMTEDSSSYPEGNDAWEIETNLCHTMDDLLKAYFQGFKLEGVEDAWRALSETWTTDTRAQKLGLPLKYVEDERYSFALVIASRRRRDARMHHLGPIDFAASDAMDAIDFRNERSVRRAINKIGTHFIHSFSTGNALIQVLAFKPSSYRRLMRSIRWSKGKPDYVRLLTSPFVDHVGHILTASGNEETAKIATRYLTTSTQSDASLISLQTNHQLRSLLEPLLGNEAILKLELLSMGRAFFDERKSEWFQEVVSNTVELWTLNNDNQMVDEMTAPKSRCKW